ncbi:hypothetical protein BJ878DRAFT_477254 [Calycina marina]|uniref:Uncharacterized protein n=1 Tax=Calycina marina TaxID=1763456 RepID=A0A9P7Z9T7_9HELO|nr:hypothetical protein BJ878DRAFT_477254 [Calycina marina]
MYLLQKETQSEPSIAQGSKFTRSMSRLSLMLSASDLEETRSEPAIAQGSRFTRSISRLSLMFNASDLEEEARSLEEPQSLPVTGIQRRSFRDMFLGLFSLTPKQLINTRPEARLRDRARTMSMMSVWSTRDDSIIPGRSESIDVAPQIQLTETFKFSVTCPEEREDHHRRDSKFSSFASLQDSVFSNFSNARSSASSTYFASSHPVILCSRDLAKLQSLTRRAARSVKEQDYLIAALSGNLAHCLMHKENFTCFNVRLSIEWRVQITEMCTVLRRLVARMFMRKLVFTQRSAHLLAAIGEQLAHAETSKRQLDGVAVLANVEILKENVGNQQTFDQEVRNCLVPPCEDLRFPASTAERAGLKRFVAFLDERLARLDISYEKTKAVVMEIESRVRELQR